MDAQTEKLIDQRLDELEALGRPIKRYNVRERIKQRFADLEEMGIRMCQSPYELADVYGALSNCLHDNYVEIGVAAGGTLWMGAMVVKTGGLIIGIDNYCEAKHNYPDSAKKVVSKLAGKYDVRLLTHKPSGELVQEVEELLKGAGIDHLHIDGSHTYEGVKADFENYGPLVKPGGLVQFHDIITTNATKQGPCGVPKYWAELKEKYPGRHREVVQPGGSIFGIGLIRMPEEG